MKDVCAVKEARKGGVKKEKLRKLSWTKRRAGGRLYSARAKRRGASRGRADATKPGGEGRDTEIIYTSLIIIDLNKVNLKLAIIINYLS